MNTFLLIVDGVPTVLVLVETMIEFAPMENSTFLTVGELYGRRDPFREKRYVGKFGLY